MWHYLHLYYQNVNTNIFHFLPNHIYNNEGLRN
nr:MAG TPA: hypothetical protein [Caudoviricetes sp.]